MRVSTAASAPSQQQGMNPDMMRKLDFTRLRCGAARLSRELRSRLPCCSTGSPMPREVSVTDEEFRPRALYGRVAVSASRSKRCKARLTEDGGLARIREQLRREKTASLLYQRLPDSVT